jgi:hypothetical protein
MSRKKVSAPKARKCYGWCGTYVTGELGWLSAQFFANTRKDLGGLEDSQRKCWTERFFLCEYTIKPLLDKRGRPITRIAKGE